ncbi:MAG: glycine--tRNA ligase [Desulfurococcales archaeon]|nr:glycine--tRNA ligase [Desulfurococcales archaeon]
MDLAKRRGFFWPSFEIYGGVSGFYDLGPLGSMLKENIRRLWLEYFVVKHSDMAVAIETPMVTPEVVFKASGHLESFTDPIVQCGKCGRVFRADQLIESATGRKVEGLTPEELTRIIKEEGIKCPVCGGELGEVRLFNLLFQTYIGPYKRDVGYLRPEAAQGMFTSFKRVFTVMRQSLPLGIAQIGRVARNEISPRQGMIRLREFTIMEMEFFYDPEEPGEPPYRRFGGKLRILTAEQRVRGDEKPITVSPKEAVEEGIVKNPWLAYWMLVSKEFVKELGVAENETFFEEKLPEERAHYATQTFDQLVKVSRWGWVEVSGHAYRGDYDLSRHMKFSGKDLTVYKRFDEEKVEVREVVKYDKALIGKLFKSESRKVIEIITKLSPDQVKKLKSSGKEVLEVEGFSIPSSAVWVEEVKEKVTGRKFIPHVVEPSFGAERLVFVALDKSFVEDGERTYLKLPPRIAPIKVAVFPLLSKPELISKAREVFNALLSSGIPSTYDESGSIGRRYARADEVGIPYAVTVDYQTLQDSTVTLRFRDTKEQVRIEVSEVPTKVRELIEAWRLEE